MDLADPSVDPVELLSRFIYWINNVKYGYRLSYHAHYCVDPWINAFITPDVCEWLWDVDRSIEFDKSGDKSGSFYRFHDALLLVEVWQAGGLVVRGCKREDSTGGWMIFVRT